MRRKAGHFVYQGVLMVVLVWMAKCSITLNDKSNWEHTTGRIGIFGKTNSKLGGSVSVYYADPATGAEQSAMMKVPNDFVEPVVNSSSEQQPAYVYTNVFGRVTVCLESVWDACNGEAKPKGYFYLLVIGLLAVSAGFLFKEYRAESGHR